MSAQFEFRLKGVDAPDGELDAEQLVAIVQSLREVATRIGRSEAQAEPLGRAPRRVRRLARLTIGLAPGSTRLLARRSGGGEDALDLELAEERAFDERFQDVIESIADDRRPDWVDDSLSAAAAELTVALQQASSEVEFKVNGLTRRDFKTGETHRETWQAVATQKPEPIIFMGRLYAVNLNTHRLQVQDAVGNQVALPGVDDESDVGRLLGTQISVTGTPEYDSRGRLVRIRQATFDAAPDPSGGTTIHKTMSLEEIVASASGPTFGGIPDLTEAESEAFFAAIGR